MAKKDITSNVLKDIFSKKLTKAKEGIAKQLRNKSIKAIEDYKNSFKFDLPSVSEGNEDQLEYIKAKDGQRRRCAGGDGRRKEAKGKSKAVIKDVHHDEDDEDDVEENLKNFKGKKAKPFTKDDEKDEGQDGGTGDKAAYQKFFNAKLKKYGVKSPSELSGADKKKFYDEIDAEWEGDNESD